MKGIMIGKRADVIRGWAIIADGNSIYICENGNWWYGGNGIGIAVYRCRRTATKYAKAIRVSKEGKEMKIQWTRTVPVYDVTV